MSKQNKYKQCPECNKDFVQFRSFQKTCTDPGCMMSYAKKKRDKKQVKEYRAKTAELKSAFYGNDLKTRKIAAKLACHAYIRQRDNGLPCICCNRSMSGKKVNAGHYIESGNHPAIRYHEDNIHAQLEYCNSYQGGNSDDYEGNLRKKIGDERVNYLISQKNVLIKRTVEDYREIESYYKQKLKELNTGIMEL